MKFQILFLFFLFFLIVVFVGIFVYTAQCAYEGGYKDACMDFYQGKLKYEIVEKTSIEWKKVNLEKIKE